MSPRRSERPPRDVGFTLAEVMVVVVILGIVSSVFAMAAAQDIGKTAAVGRTSVESAETFLLSDKLLGDIRDADAVGVGSPSTACGTGATPVFWTRSTDTSTPNPNQVVAAYAENFTATPALNQPLSVELDRTMCTGGSQSKTVAVAQWADPAPVALPLPSAPSAADVPITFGCDLPATSCKPNLLTFAAGLDAINTTPVISSDSDLPTASTSPAPSPLYYLVVEPGTNQEIVGVTADDTATQTLTLSRPAPVDHGSAAVAVSYQPRTVKITVPRNDTDWHSGFAGLSDSFVLTVTRRPQ